jgi:hypothetical protein
MDALFNKYICNLLLEHDCVIIPEFGGFVANYAPAKIHPTQHTFEPPYKQIAFNKNLTNNDGLLANAIAIGESYSFATANSKLEEEVLRLQIRLAKKENIELDAIGTLYLDVESNLQFKPATTQNFLLDSFGLSTFQSPAIKRDNYDDRLEKQFINRPPIQNPAKATRKRKLWPVLLTVPFLIALLVLNFKSNLFPKINLNYSTIFPLTNAENPIYKQRTESLDFKAPIEKTSSSLLNSSTESIVYISLTGDNSKTIPVKMELDESIVSSDSNEGVGVSNAVQEHAYYLIAGCFKEKENADALVATLKAKGFEAEIIGQNNSGLFRVSYHQFKDMVSANAAKAEIKLENHEVWVFQN